MIRDRAFHECRVSGIFSDQRAVYVVAEFVAECRGDRAGMMRGVDEDHELAFVAEVGTAEKSTQRQPCAGFIRFGTQFKFARTENFEQMIAQLLAAERRQAVVCRGVSLDVILDYLRQFPEQRLGWKRGRVRVIGGENLFQVSKRIEDSGSERAQRNLDLAEQLGDELVNFASFQLTGSAHEFKFCSSTTFFNSQSSIAKAPGPAARVPSRMNQTVY